MTTLFTDVYDELPWNLRQQQESLRGHLESYKGKYEQFATTNDL